MPRRVVRLCVWGLVVSTFLELFVIANENSEDDWVDPFDMLNYDRHSKTMMYSGGSTQEQRSDQNALNVCNDSLRRCEKTLTEMKLNISGGNTVVKNIVREEQQHQSSCSDVEAESRLYMRRFVNVLMEAAGMSRVSGEKFSSRQFDIRISVTDEQLSLLRRFSRNEGDVALRTLDSILSDVLKPNFSWIPESILMWLEYFFSNFSSQQVGYTTLMLLVPTTAIGMMLMGCSMLKIVSQSLIMTFVVGFIFTYNRMYKIQEIRSYIHQKQHSEMPEQCSLSSPSEMSWYQWFFSYGSNVKECQKYYEAVWIDPSLHVSPELVLSEMAAVFVLHPGEQLAKTIVKFSDTIIGGLPFGTNWIVLILSMVMLIAVMVLTCGLIAGGQVGFYGLHVGLSRRQPITIQNTEIPAVESLLPPTGQQIDNGKQPSTITPPVFNISINLPTKFSFGRSEGSGNGGSVTTLKLTGLESSGSNGERNISSGDSTVRSVQNVEDGNAVSSSSGSEVFHADESASCSTGTASNPDGEGGDNMADIVLQCRD